MQWVGPTAPWITTPTGSFASSCRLRQLPVIFCKIFLECKVISSCRFCWIANFSAVRAMLQSTTWILHGSLAGWVLLDIGQHHHGQVAHTKKYALWIRVKYKRMGAANTEQAPQCRNTNGHERYIDLDGVVPQGRRMPCKVSTNGKRATAVTTVI